MDKRLLHTLACPACQGGLKFSGESDDRQLITGEFGCKDCGLAFPVLDGVAELVPPDVDYEGAMWDALEDIVCQLPKWVADNFAFSLNRKQPPLFQKFIDEVRAAEGPIVDIASGPGGSFCVDVMKDGNINRLLVMSDLGRPVMNAWRQQLCSIGWTDRCSCMVFDARRMPFKDESISLFTSVIGFGSVIKGHPAYKEAGRVLKPGGRIIGIEKFFEEGGPTQRARREYGDLTSTWLDYQTVLTDAGFRIDSSEICSSGRGKSDPMDGIPEDDELWECRLVFASKK